LLSDRLALAESERLAAKLVVKQPAGLPWSEENQVKNTLKVCDLTVALGRMGGNRTLLSQMAQFLFDSAPQLMERLEAAAREGNTEVLLRTAHSLKGLVVNFDAEAVAETLQRIEHRGRAGDSSTAAADVTEAQQRLSDLLQEITEGLQRV